MYPVVYRALNYKPRDNTAPSPHLPLDASDSPCMYPVVYRALKFTVTPRNNAPSVPLPLTPPLYASDSGTPCMYPVVYRALNFTARNNAAPSMAHTYPPLDASGSLYMYPVVYRALNFKPRNNNAPSPHQLFDASVSGTPCMYPVVHRALNFTAIKIPGARKMSLEEYGLVVVTSIETTKEVVGDVIYHKFTGYTAGSVDHRDAVVLRNVVDTGDKKSTYNVYKGIEMSKEEAQLAIEGKINAQDSAAKKVLLCIHGNITEPCNWIPACEEMNGKLNEYVVIPVLWPADSESWWPLTDYQANRKYSKAAGVAFGSAVDISRNVSTSVMSHSMGNRVLLSFADSGETRNFEAVFMVAADIWEETFNARVINNTDIHPGGFKADAGLKLLDMVNTKVVVVHNQNDIPLLGSHKVNSFRRRLGQFGKEGQEGRLHSKAVEKLVNFDFNPHKTNNDDSHSYQFCDVLIREIYNKY
mmetsp:Transcript_49984/g.60130  ORF Transcript_49984/g.60130 Transcript_49984/m.60130 type:complete len:471 (+) Transcript_49984:1-1413(+)